jgi:hypothetical protein
MQITLTDQQYQRLRSRSMANGSSIAELVRRSIDADGARVDARERLLASTTPSPLTTEERLAAIRGSAGIWKKRGSEVYEDWHRRRGHDLLGEEYEESSK